jgi:hypothetical protein
MFSEKLITAMRQKDVLKISHIDSNGAAHFNIDFNKAEKYFPQFIEQLILMNLGAFDREVYTMGFMAYTILPDGRLQWKPTKKLNAIIDACKNTHSA